MERKLLSTWNQIAPRVYQRQWFCFPCWRDARPEGITSHLRSALDRLASHFPHLTCKISLLSGHPGYLCIYPDDDAKISLRVYDERNSYNWTYAQLEAQGFPAKAFVHPCFDLPYELLENSEGIPVFEVHARLIEGGLLLGIYSHHSVSDGTAIHKVVSSLAQLTIEPTRLPMAEYTDIHLDLPPNLLIGSGHSSSSTFHDLLSKCPEYQLLSSLTGPTQFRISQAGMPWKDIQKTGRVFIFGAQQIEILKHRITECCGHSPSTFTCLAALSWAYVTKARLSSPINLLSSSPGEKMTIPNDVRLMISTDWRQRAFTGTMGPNAGNAVALPKTALDTGIVLAACSRDESISSPALGTITQAIEAMVRNVDDSFVALRTALFREAPDPRLIGVDADPRDPRDFYFNSWRHFGGQTRWKIPGAVEQEGDKNGGGVAPDAIRRAQAEWNIGAGLILPARKGCLGSEVLITLDVDAMECLCEDADWKLWVNEILE
ncbi:unnamed protein product [Clonostachys solani]|uniref:Trichothecene 3-O-acetyltransferase-like N-terminal domain-containing protein n=1 Tax=Clonostachys solani TaxID=160281 RepID=A0A9N9ZN36_9HYPO|nr:unnamed protein product [Clonostachys solani]